jgi:hypothetical protein
MAAVSRWCAPINTSLGAAPFRLPIPTSYGAYDGLDHELRELMNNA